MAAAPTHCRLTPTMILLASMAYGSYDTRAVNTPRLVGFFNVRMVCAIVLFCFLVHSQGQNEGNLVSQRLKSVGLQCRSSSRICRDAHLRRPDILSPRLRAWAVPANIVLLGSILRVGFTGLIAVSWPQRSWSGHNNFGGAFQCFLLFA